MDAGAFVLMLCGRTSPAAPLAANEDERTAAFRTNGAHACRESNLGDLAGGRACYFCLRVAAERSCALRTLQEASPAPWAGRQSHPGRLSARLTRHRPHPCPQVAAQEPILRVGDLPDRIFRPDLNFSTQVSPPDNPEPENTDLKILT